MQSFPLVTNGIHAVAALLVAALLHHFQRAYRRPGLRDWTLSFWAEAVSLPVGTLAIFVGRHLGAIHPSTVVLAAGGRAAVFVQEALLLTGTYAMATGRGVPRPALRGLLAALLVVALVLSLPLPLEPAIRLLVQSLAHPFVAGAAFSVAGAALWLSAREPRLIGTRLLALGFLGTGLDQVHFFALGVASLLGWEAGSRLVHTGAPNAVLQVDFLLQMTIAVAMIVWLLEEEREAAVATSEALRRSEQRHELAARRARRRPADLGGVGQPFLDPGDCGRAHGRPPARHLGRGPAPGVGPPQGDDVREGHAVGRGRARGAQSLFALSSTLDAFEIRYGGAERYRRYLSVLRSEVERLGDLMRDLLDYGRLPVLDLSPGALDAAIDGAIRSCAPASLRARVSLERHLEPDLPPVFRDAGRLTLVFEDLIQNAVQVDRHGGTIAVGNHPAGGALVTVRLPVRSAARASA